MTIRFRSGLQYAGWCVTLATVFLTGTNAPALAIEACVARLSREAEAQGIRPDIVARMLATAKADERVIRFATSQPEYETPIWDYMAFLVDEARIRDGEALLKQHARTLAAVETAYGVERQVVVAVWGIESDFGKARGDFYTPHALANLACAGGRRADYFRDELMKTLLIASRGDVPADKFQGSWAGAFGQTQFMPTTYLRLAVDFDRDGRKDLVDTTADALASTANFLKDAGWEKGRPWGYEVRLPKGYNGPVGRRERAALSTWAKRGLVRLDGKPLSGGLEAGLILPAGETGPAFLVTRNFDALFSYNASQSYGLAIALLSQLISGGEPFKAAWPTEDPGLSRAQRLDLQKRLADKGFYDGEVDGRVGPATREAIRRAEENYGLQPTGRPGYRIYQALGGG
ncbi:lytic murein transglycosylase [Microvirga tunisiensis]|uniref:Lytic murein transglycosylase n=2 Tax=Pannonibacter tanglangensis TaxID=2750084 RepID=A0ABW9ZCJ6_9HYPH|nr:MULTISPECIES: lytic murein transglycosylase [unclassified Pannonibacter]NBN62560.1 lytic murein transglycosylase [Pannonibacter sp. XCT-34]NBN78215.1 lytic murein transglycosylase [Pannonibacter sp. XCT-53]